MDIEKDMGGYKIDGDLTLHGVTKSIDFDLDTNGEIWRAWLSYSRKTTE